MKIHHQLILFTALAASFSHAATLLPTGTILGGHWGGFSVNGTYEGAVFAGASRYDLLDTVGEVHNSTGTFQAAPGYVVKPGWNGTFGITSTKLGNTAGDAASIVTVPFESFQPAPGSLVDSVQGYTYIQFGTNGSGARYEFDFSGLEGGSLPAGTIISLDGLATVGANLSIFSNTGLQFLDYVSNTTLFSNDSSAIASVDYDSGIFNYTILSNNGDFSAGAPATFVTNQSLTSLTLLSSTSDAHTVFFSAPVVVPEPSAAALLGVAGLVGAFRRSRRTVG